MNNHTTWREQMREAFATLTTKGQITVPIEVRRVLALKPGDRILFRVSDDNKVELAPSTMTLESTFGAVKPMQQPENFQELTETAHEEQVQEVLAKLDRE